MLDMWNRNLHSELNSTGKIPQDMFDNKNLSKEEFDCWELSHNKKDIQFDLCKFCKEDYMYSRK